MKKTIFVVLGIALLPACALAVDGVVLINQSTVVAAGGFPYIISQPGSYKLSGNLIMATSSTSVGKLMSAAGLLLSWTSAAATAPTTRNR